MTKRIGRVICDITIMGRNMFGPVTYRILS